MRRENYEMCVSPPEVVYKIDEDGSTLEPIEEVKIEIEPSLVPNVIDNLNNRKGVLLSSDDNEEGNTVLRFDVPSRGMIGFWQYIVNLSWGKAIVESGFSGYDHHRGSVSKTSKGAIISVAEGDSTAYALWDIEARGKLFIGPQIPVYNGQVIGESSVEHDVNVNPVKAKKVTNVWTKSADEAIRLQPPRLMGLEEYFAYMWDDELVDICMSGVRLRKKILSMEDWRWALWQQKSARI